MGGRSGRLLAAMALCTGTLGIASVGTPAGGAAGPGTTVTLARAASAVATPAAKPALHWTLSRPPGTWFLSGTIAGTLGRTVQVQALGGTASSAPLHIDTVGQRFGLTIVTTDASPFTIDVLPQGEWATGDRFTVADVQLAASTASVTTVPAGTRLMNVNGTNFTAKGYVYWPAPIGEFLVAQSWADPVQCQNDARLMAGAHVTLVRLPLEFATPIVQSNYTACLDAFAANGIGVLWSINPPTGGEKPPATGNTPVDYQADMAAWVPPYEQWIKYAVDTFGHHPATYIWSINNEADGSVDGTCSTRDLWLGNKASGQPALAEALFGYTKSLDSNHVVTTSVAGCVDQALDTVNVPSLDLWAVNSYGPTHASGTGSYWANLKKDPRPVMFTEWGTDRYTCWGGTAHGVSCSTAFGSGENQVDQRDWDALTWDNIAANLATPTNPQGAVIGGTKFMYSDLWWYSLPFTTGGPATHDVGGDWANGWGTDGVQNFKWWGASAALPAGSTQMRYTSLAFDALGDRWGTPGPAITSVNIAFFRMANNNCLADVTWTTSEAATTQLLGGLNLEAGNQGGDMVVDNTLFGVYSEDGTLTTTHHAQALDLLNGSHYKFAVRSFTSDGRHHTTEPMIRNHIAC